MLLDISWIAMVLTGLGSLFLFGELLVNMKGIFAVLGIGFISVYFLSHLTPTVFILAIIIYFLGILLIIIDGKFLNDGTLSTIGVASILVTVGLSAPNWLTGIYGVLGVILGGLASLLFLKVFPKRKMWGKITLLDRMTTDAGYNSMNAGYQHLVGKEGVTITNLRPVGTIKIDDKEYSAVSNGHWIPNNTPIIVVLVDGTKILVKNIEKK